MADSNTTLYIPAAEVRATLHRILLNHGLSEERAATCAEIFTENSLDGVYSHGVNRFPRFVEYLKGGQIKAANSPVCVHRAGSLEQWDGQSGPGPINALACTERAMALAREYGMGCVAIANTNHWMRGGTYGWHAAKAGFVYIAWTNTIANMPPWGATTARLGNNPLIIAVPWEKEAIVLDMAMSQYSYGALEVKQLKKEQVPLPGGYDSAGKLTTDPGAIIASRRPLPIGYWKGAGLSLLLDVLATILSGGRSTAQITAQGSEFNVSQVFLTIDLSRLHNYPAIGNSIRAILDDYHSATPEKAGAAVRYPGEQVVAIRAENTRRGIPVLKETWEAVTGGSVGQ